MRVKINMASTAEQRKPMGRGRRPVETLPDHGINIGADVTKL